MITVIKPLSLALDPEAAGVRGLGAMLSQNGAIFSLYAAPGSNPGTDRQTHLPCLDKISLKIKARHLNALTSIQNQLIKGSD